MHNDRCSLKLRTGTLALPFCFGVLMVVVEVVDVEAAASALTLRLWEAAAAAAPVAAAGAVGLVVVVVVAVVVVVGLTIGAAETAAAAAVAVAAGVSLFRCLTVLVVVAVDGCLLSRLAPALENLRVALVGVDRPLVNDWMIGGEFLGFTTFSQRLVANGARLVTCVHGVCCGPCMLRGSGTKIKNDNVPCCLL
jgi:hypothetical protein